MRLALIILLIFGFADVKGQSLSDTTKYQIAVFSGPELKTWLDSLKSQMLLDTTKFNKSDLWFSATGRRNTKPYSPLFIINGTYAYKIDIVDGSQVIAFLNEILDYKKIKSASYIDSSKSTLLFAYHALKGAVYITMFKKAKFDPKVAGLILRKRKSGDNYTTIKKGELVLHD